MKVGVIVSAYNNAPVLRHCLLALQAQTEKDFRVIIADDGSNDSVRNLLRSPEFASLSIDHIWHEDRGFRRAHIFNKAIKEANADYLIMTDADCIPRNDFVERHIMAARKKRFVSGGIINIPIPVHKQFTEEDITSNRIFDLGYLCKIDAKLSKLRLRLLRSSFWLSAMNLLTWRLAVLRGNNSAAWRDDLIAVNGFDEGFVHYGAEDRDLGIRLFNSGCYGSLQKYSIVAIHQDHAKPYCNPALAQENRNRAYWRILSRQSWVEPGLASPH